MRNAGLVDVDMTGTFEYRGDVIFPGNMSESREKYEIWSVWCLSGEKGVDGSMRRGLVAAVLVLLRYLSCETRVDMLVRIGVEMIGVVAAVLLLLSRTGAMLRTRRGGSSMRGVASPSLLSSSSSLRS